MIAAGRRGGFAVLPRAQSGCRVTGDMSAYPKPCAIMNGVVQGEVASLAKEGRLGGVVIAGSWPIDAKWRNDLEKIVTSIVSDGGRVLLVMDNIRFKYDPTACYSRRGAEGCDLGRPAVEQRRAKVRAALESVAAGRPDVRIMDALDQVCSKDRCPVATTAGMLYFDHNHLTRMGADFYIEPLGKQAEWLLGRGDTAPERD